MEMIPDQKPPVPRGEGPLAKAIFFGIIALLIGGVALYIMYPPLQKAGLVNLRNGEKLTVYLGETSRADGQFQHITILEAPSTPDLDLLLALAIGQCEEVLKESRLLGTRQRIAPTGEMMVRFVQGGRFLYRFYAFDDWQMRYNTNNKTCMPAPYLTGDMEDWALNRWEFTDRDGETELEVWFRWTGQGESPDLPMKDVCEKVLSNPLRAFREHVAGDIDTITIAAERGYFGLFEISTWRSQSFKRVKNLCLEIEPEEEDA